MKVLNAGVEMVQHLKDYLAYWGLKSPPFEQGDEQSSNLYIPTEWEAIIERMLFFCERSSSLLILTSQPGHCKSTIAKWFHQNLDINQHEVFLFSLYQNQEHSGWLIPTLGKLLGRAAEPKQDELEYLGQAIDEINQEKKILTLLIDEAHKLKTEASFQDLHSLISAQSITHTRLNLVLFGGAQLHTNIQKSESLRNRTNLTSHIPPLTADQMRSYLSQHFTKIGLEPKIISFDAYSVLNYHSQGLFSRLNTLVENCLIEAFLRKEKTIHSETVRAAAHFLPDFDQAKSNSMTSDRRPDMNSKVDSSSRLTEAHSDGDGMSRDSAASKSIELKRLFYKSGNAKAKKNSLS